TGFLGLLALVAWMVLAIRRASGPLLGFALVGLAMHLVEPQFVGTTPLVLLALGAAAAAAPSPRHAVTVATAVLLIPALGAAVLLLYGDFEVDQARLDFNMSAARTAADVLAPWQEPAALAGRVSVFNYIRSHAPADAALAVRWKREAL